MSHFDLRTNQCELEVQMIIYLQKLANQLQVVFTDTKKVTKSHISIANTQALIDVPDGQLANESKIHLKYEKPIDSKDITPRKRRTQIRIDTPKEVYDKQKASVEAYDKQKAPKEVYSEQETHAEAYIEQETPKGVQNKETTIKEAHVLENFEISMSYVHKGYKRDRNDIIINNIFFFPSGLRCDAPKPGGPLTTLQPTEYKWMSGYPTPL